MNDTVPDVPLPCSQNIYTPRRGKVIDFLFSPVSYRVIAKSGRDAMTVPDRTYEEAGMLAAYYSKGRDSASVPVDYTEVYNVKKPSGAKPGMVIYVDYSTMYVTPTSELVDKLEKVRP